MCWEDKRQLFKRMFSKFQNLNLLFLIEDVRSGRTARGMWKSGQNLCPVAHGWRDDWACRLLQTPMIAVKFDSALSAMVAGLQADEVLPFTSWWDVGHSITKQKILLDILEEIYQERLIDADTVQQVINVPVPLHSKLPTPREEACRV